jgi:hypothetical protein
MSRRVTFPCSDPLCRTNGKRTELGCLFGAMLELRPGVTADPLPGGAEILCPACGRRRRYQGKVVMIVSERAIAC